MNKKNQFDQYSKFRDPLRFYVTQFVRLVSNSVLPGSSILDAGAGECVYKKYFKHCKYISADYCVGDDNWNYKNIDLKCKLSEIPVKSNSYDNVLCTQTLEHVNNPDDVLAELNRVLKKGGKLYLSVPFLQSEHQLPHDYFRYTKNGLRYLFEKNNFSVDSIDSGGGHILVAGIYFKHIPALIFKNKYVSLLKWAFLVITNVIFYFLTLFDDNNKDDKDEPTFCYMVTATKK